MSHETLNHVSVLIKESIELLKINPNGIYLDCTFGRGGHSQKILEHLGSQGQLIAIDKDQEAIKAAKKIKDQRFEIFQTNFLNFDEILKKKVLKNWMES
ncbi:MAG: 16S rRNA (cytosine(1402)-N(4))-methyltransferase [Methylophilaceae bacterium]